MPKIVSRNMRREDGQGLVELIVSLVILAVGIGSLLTLLTSSALSLQRSGQKGTALVLAERQIELYRSVGFRDIRLSDSAQSAAAALTSDPYVTANSSDSSIPSATNQITDADADTNPCGSPLPTECLPTQPVEDLITGSTGSTRTSTPNIRRAATSSQA